MNEELENLKTGDVIRYWTRRKGERSRLVEAQILYIDASRKFARVKLYGDDHLVPIQLIELSRLKPIANEQQQ